MVDVRGSAELPAERTPLELRTADGLTLVAELATPAGRPPVATLVCFHPLTVQGGSMDSHLYRKAARRLPALAGIAVLRVNARGAASAHGRSDGAYDGGVGERHDVAAAVDAARRQALPAPWLVGWSFGSELVLRYALEHPEVLGGVLLSPPLRRCGDRELATWAADGRPLLALVPEHDEHLTPAEAAPRFARVPQCELVAVRGAKHLWVGEAHVRRALDEIVARVAPGRAPLPTTWPPPEETG
ncbi:MAG: alpha/beta hydrolase [Frankiaceae bacterium]